MNVPMDDKKVARMLRSQGYSYSEINQKLSKSRSKSTLSYWFRDIPLSKVEQEQIRNRFSHKLSEARQRSLINRKEARKAYLDSVARRTEGLEIVLKDERTRKALLGALYLAEGSKNSGTLTFANSNPAIIRLYLYLLRTCFSVNEKKLRCTVLARADQPIRELNLFWERVTAIPSEQFYAARVDARTYGKPTKKIEYKGVCRIDYISADLFHEIMSIGTILTSSVR